MNPKTSLAATIMAALALAGTAAFGQQDQVVYDDALQSGWTDWSWAAANLTSTVSPHAGGNCIAVTALAYEALYLHREAFATRAYSNLTFWIRGAASGGLLQLRATLGGSPQAAVNLPALTTAWTHMSLPLSSLGVTNKSNMDGFWIQERNGNSVLFYVDDIRITVVPAPSTVHVTVNAAQKIRRVDARYFGLNTAVWDSLLDTTNTIGLLKELDNRVLRFPGGALSDDYHWASNTSGTNTWQWTTSPAAFLHVATNTGAQAFITVNYGSGSAAEAAEWVRWANLTNRAGILYWEVGNENYGGWETDTNSRPHDPFTYATRFKDYAAQMKAVDPAIRVGAVAQIGEDAYATYTDHPATNARTHAVHNGWTPVMLATFKTLGVRPDFLIYHRYAQSPRAESDADLLQSAVSWPEDAADLRRQLNDYLGAAATNVELVCTENNSVYANPGKQSTSLINGLFLADSVAQAMLTEFNAVLWWDLRNAQEAGNNNVATLYGWRNYGDYGITDSSDPSTAVNRYPTFHAAKLFRYFARGGDWLVPATSDYPLLAVYAAQRTNDFLALLVINKSASNSLNAAVSVSGFAFATNAPLMAYGMPQDNAARSNLSASAGMAITNALLAGTNFTYTFPPYSATVLAMAGTSVVRMDSPSAATNGMKVGIRSLPGLRCSIESSTNLTGWTPLVTNVLSDAAFDWLDLRPGLGQSVFYRAAWWL